MVAAPPRSLTLQGRKEWLTRIGATLSRSRLRGINAIAVVPISPNDLRCCSCRGCNLSSIEVESCAHHGYMTVKLLKTNVTSGDVTEDFQLGLMQLGLTSYLTMRYVIYGYSLPTPWRQETIWNDWHYCHCPSCHLPNIEILTTGICYGFSVWCKSVPNMNNCCHDR